MYGCPEPRDERHHDRRTVACARTDVTDATTLPYLVRMRTDWPEREAFNALLDRLRSRSPYQTALALAEAAGISHTTLSSWRSGRQRPTLGNLQKVADALGVEAALLAEAAGIDLTRLGMARQLQQDPDPHRYIDPDTGEQYDDPAEQAIWDLPAASPALRRSYIYQLRAERQASERGQRQAG